MVDLGVTWGRPGVDLVAIGSSIHALRRGRDLRRVQKSNEKQNINEVSNKDDVPILQPICSVTDGSGPSDSYPCACGTTSHTPDTPVCSDANGGEKCTASSDTDGVCVVLW